MDPDIILFDEITSALDPNLTVNVMDIIKELRARGTTMVIVTHHIEFATTLCDRIPYLSNGKIIQIDEPEELRSNPKTLEIEQFLDVLYRAR